MTTMTPDRPAQTPKGEPAAMPLLRTTLTPRNRPSVPREAVEQPAIVSRDFRFSYGGPDLTLKGISLSVAKKAVTAIIGPRGAASPRSSGRSTGCTT